MNKYKDIPYRGVISEEVILAEERTTEEEKMHIMEGLLRALTSWPQSKDNDMENFLFLARRRNAAKRKKLKSLGKSKSTDTEEEEAEEDYGDDGKNRVCYGLSKSKSRYIHMYVCSCMYNVWICCKSAYLVNGNENKNIKWVSVGATTKKTQLFDKSNAECNHCALYEIFLRKIKGFHWKMHNYKTIREDLGMSSKSN